VTPVTPPRVTRRRVLVVTDTLQPPGGGGAIGAWAIQALKDAYAVTVLTWTPVDLPAINRYFGTTIAPGDVETIGVPGPLRRAVDALPARLELLRMAVVVAVARRRRAAFDVLLSPDAELDLGAPTIQYVNLPGRYQWRGLPAHRGVSRWYHRASALTVYERLVDRLAPTSLERLRANLTLVNSDWTGARMRDALGFSGTTLYPPVAGRFDDVPWAEREAAFVSIGRMVPHKGLEHAIDIVEAVRRRGGKARLHLVSPPTDAVTYERLIEDRIAAAGGWVERHRNLSRAALCALVSRCRYGLHTALDEPFGMAVGELVRGGCIVWVARHSGGPREIVGADERLLWQTPAEAAEKIVRVLEDPAAEADLRTHLAARGRTLGAEQFVERVRAIVDAFPGG
jgi:glycosyltransferase involved in cell wall biosynthesis